MEKYKIRYTAAFYEDLSEAVEYIDTVLKNPYSADRLIDSVEKAIIKRSSYPLSFRPCSLKHHHDHDYYSINVGNYAVFYVVIDDVMEVRRSIYARRSIGDII